MRKVMAISLGLLVIGLSVSIVWAVTPVVEVLSLLENEYEFTRHFSTTVADNVGGELVNGK